MNTYGQPGNVIPVTVAGANAVSGVPFKKGDAFYVPQVSGLIGVVIQAAMEGCFTLPKVSAQAWTEGQQINWDDTAKLCTTVTTGNFKIGTAVAVAVNPSATGYVRLAGVNLGAALA